MAISKSFSPNFNLNTTKFFITHLFLWRKGLSEKGPPRSKFFKEWLYKFSCCPFFYNFLALVLKLCNFLVFQDLLVLLDLIGAANPSFYSYFPNTHKHYQQLVGIEENLTKLNLIHHKNKRVRYFKAKSTSARIEDDHLPFLEKGNFNLQLVSIFTFFVFQKIYCYQLPDFVTMLP